jgi:hypothetical protein
MGRDKVSPADINDEVAAHRDNNLVTPKTFEMMTDGEREDVMREREERQEHPEWGSNRWGEPRPLSGWDRLWD